MGISSECPHGPPVQEETRSVSRDPVQAHPHLLLVGTGTSGTDP